MITLEDCIGFCGLTEEEVLAIAEHEHLPEIAAAAFAQYLLSQEHGPEMVRDMIVDDIREAQHNGANKDKALILLHVLHHFLRAHPNAAPPEHPWSKRGSELAPNAQRLKRKEVMDLTTNYMGLQLKNPLVASASPLCADLGNIRHLEDSGAAAIVLPSIFEEQIEADMLNETTAVGLENSPAARGYLPKANQRESQQYLDLIRRAVEAVDIPVIGSLNGTTEEGWISYAKMIEQAGATGLELNVYFIPTDISLTGRDVEQRYLEILRAVRKAVDIPIAIKLGPYFSSMWQVAMEFANAGADALVLFNRFYQPDINLTKLRLHNDLQLSKANEIGLPLMWIAVLSGRIDASLAASTGVENSEQVLKYLLAGADVVMTTSALLRNGPHYVKELLCGTVSWLSAHDIESVGKIRGLLSQRNFRNPDSFGRENYMKILQGYEYSETSNSTPVRTNAT